VSKASFEPALSVVNVRYAGIDPKHQFREIKAQALQGRVIVIFVFDCIKIRDIEFLEGKNRQKPSRDVGWSARRGQWGFDRRIGAANSHARMDHSSVFEINNWYDFHDSAWLNK
jgi:hypothetical protein